MKFEIEWCTAIACSLMRIWLSLLSSDDKDTASIYSGHEPGVEDLTAAPSGILLRNILLFEILRQLSIVKSIHSDLEPKLFQDKVLGQIEDKYKE